MKTLRKYTFIYPAACLGLVLLAACEISPYNPATLPSPTPQVTLAAPSPSSELATSLPSATITVAAPAAPTGTTAAPAKPVNTSSGDTAHFVSETIPDNTRFAAGEKFRKTWKLKNSGTATWDKAYTLYVISSNPAGQTLDSPGSVAFAADTPPGGELEIGVDLNAPETNGTYTVHYGIRRPDGGSVLVDGSNLWVTIQVGSDSGQTTAHVNQVSAILGAHTFGETASEVQFCMNLPDDTPSWFPFDMVLVYGNNALPASGGGVVNYQAGSTYRCYRAEFPIGTGDLNDLSMVQLSVGGIGIDGSVYQQENCARAQNEINSSHPGLTFKCGQPGFFYTLKTKPDGMDDGEADQIIMDAIERRLYGPWVLTIK